MILPPKGHPLRQSRRIKDLVSTVDLFPTIIKLAGLDPPPNQGHDLVDWIASGQQKPIRTEIYAQAGGYHGYIKTSWPSGMPESGRHPNIIQTARNRRGAYVRDLDNGDEAYDLTSDPKELINLMKSKDTNPDHRIDQLAQKISTFEAECFQLRESLGVIPGDRGFVKGWE